MTASGDATSGVERAAAAREAGRRRHEAGDFKGARAAYAEALALAPSDPDVLALLGVLDHQEGRFEASVDHLRKAIRLRPSAESLSNLALSLVRLGRHDEAEASFREALAMDPTHAPALHGLGGVLFAAGRHGEAADAFEGASAILPDRADLRLHLAASRLASGDASGALAAAETAAGLDPSSALAPFYQGGALHALDRLEEAEAAYERALTIEPRLGSAAENLGAVLRRRGRTEAAVQAYARALAADPGRLGPLVMQAGLLLELKRPVEAVDPARRALELAPDHAEARLLLGLALVETGAFEEGAAHLEAAPAGGPGALSRLCALLRAYKETFAYDRALEAARAAVAVDPDRARALARLGGALVDAGFHAEAGGACLEAIALDPACCDAAVNLAAARIEEGRLRCALEALDRALSLDPLHQAALSNRAVALYRQGRTADAVAAFERALSRGGGPAHRFSYGLALLKVGRFEEGWRAFEARRDIEGPRRITRSRTLEAWAGDLRSDAVLLIEAEQGLGDAVQCLRFIGEARRRVKAVRLMVRAPLQRICRHVADAAEILEDGDDHGDANLYAPLFSLPGLLDPALARLDGRAYLAPPEGGAEVWKARLGPGGVRVGLVWQGNPTAAVEKGRSYPLEIALSALSRTGAELVSLQKDHGLDQAEAPFADGRLRSLGTAYELGDLAETAAAMAALDVIVTCDTAVAHLAGALGRPCYVALNRVSDWRWGEGGRRTRWYDSLTLCRQGRSGDWAPVFKDIARDVARLVAARPGRQGAGRGR